MLTVNGEMEVRSGSADAFRCLDGSSVTATLIDNRGGFSVDSDDSIRSFIADEETAVQPSPVNVAPDSLVTRVGVVDLPGTYPVPPGYYPQGLVASEGQYILTDGIYYFDGPGIDLSGAASITGENVLVIIGDSSTLRVDGADIQISTTDQVGTFSNPDRIALFSNQTSSDDLEIIGTAAVTVEGVFMASKSNLSCENSTLAATTLVCGTLRGRSGASIDLGPESRHPVRIRIVD